MKKITDTTSANIIKEDLAAAVNKGVTQTEFVSAQLERIKAGEIPSVGEGYLENVFRTETSNIYNAQRNELNALPEINRVLKGFKIMNPDDDRSRPSHAAIDGMEVVAGGQADLALGSPPFSYQCILPGQVIQADVFTAVESFYSGEAIEIVTARGGKVSVTANHPVKSESGFVAAKDLREGVPVFFHDGWQRTGPFVENLFSGARNDFGGATIKSLSDDELHGDAANCNRDAWLVDIPGGFRAGARTERNMPPVPDLVASTRRFTYTGNVYDFTSDTGELIVNGIVFSNCRCVRVPIINNAPDFTVDESPDALQKALAVERF